MRYGTASELTLSPVDGETDELRAALAAASLPVDDLAEPGRAFFRITEDGRTLGFGGYELHGPDALPRSIVVTPEARGRGLGREATRRLLREAAKAGARHAYLLTETAAPFFERLGFARITRAAAPETILATRQASALCPSSAALLARPLEA